MGETENSIPDPEQWWRELRRAAMHMAIQINDGQAARSDYQEVIRAARDIFAFLKDG